MWFSCGELRILVKNRKLQEKSTGYNFNPFHIYQVIFSLNILQVLFSHVI